jgi:hypothetical protein
MCAAAGRFRQRLRLENVRTACPMAFLGVSHFHDLTVSIASPGAGAIAGADLIPLRRKRNCRRLGFAAQKWVHDGVKTGAISAHRNGLGGNASNIVIGTFLK